MSIKIVIRGGGDLATGVAIRLHRAGLKLLITELPQPLVVRRKVAFAEAVYAGEAQVEGITSRRVADLKEAQSLHSDGSQIPVLVNPHGEAIDALRPLVVVDARMTKQSPDIGLKVAPLVIGLGPGFVAGENCHAAIETMRGHTLGRVIWQGAPLPNTGAPGAVHQHQGERVLRAPAEGVLHAHAQIGDHLQPGDLIAEVAGHQVAAPFKGVLRGLLHSGLQVTKGFKIGDLDPRGDPTYCITVSDKSLAVGGAVLEAILARPAVRTRLWD